MTTRAVSREAIGSWIAARRRIMGWTQQELGHALAERTGDDTWIHHKAAKLSKIENGRLGLDADLLSLIAEIQGCSIEWYYQPVDPYNEPPSRSEDIPRYLNRARARADNTVIPLRRRHLEPVPQGNDDERVAA